MKIRITGAGIYGLEATADNPHGQYPVGHEITLGKDGNGKQIVPPAGWSGRYEIVSGKMPEDAEFVTGSAAERGTESKDQADQPRRARPAQG